MYDIKSLSEIFWLTPFSCPAQLAVRWKEPWLKVEEPHLRVSNLQREYSPRGSLRYVCIMCWTLSSISVAGWFGGFRVSIGIVATLTRSISLSSARKGQHKLRVHAHFCDNLLLAVCLLLPRQCHTRSCLPNPSRILATWL